MYQLKRYFISAYITLVAILSVVAAYQLISPEHDWGPALGLLLAAGPPFVFFLWLLILRPARTSAHPLGYTLLSAAGVIVTMLAAQQGNTAASTSFYLAALAFIGWYLYLRWYSRLPSPELDHLKPGQTLPGFTLESPSGQLIDSASFRGRPHIFMFYRGNWCPLCVAQVSEIAAQWQQLEQRGAQVVLVSPQPQEHTQALAKRFSAPMQFLCDPKNRAAHRLGIAAPGGLPFGLELFGYQADVVLPTILISDSESIIRYARISDNYRVRPEPEVFIQLLEQIERGEKPHVS